MNDYKLIWSHNDLEVHHDYKRYQMNLYMGKRPKQVFLNTTKPFFLTL